MSISSQLATMGWDCTNVDTRVTPDFLSSNNLAADDVWLEIRRAFEDGRFSAAHMGPDSSTGPHSRPNHHYQIHCVSLAERLYELGTPFSIEFPAKASGHHVTLRDLPAAKALLQKQGVHLFRLDRGRTERLTRKPTELVCFGKGWPTKDLPGQWLPTGKRCRDGTPVLTPPRTPASAADDYSDRGFNYVIANALAASHHLHATAPSPPGAGCPQDTISPPPRATPLSN